MPLPRVLIVTPALASANNGNWQTAWRWQRMLRSHFDVSIDQQWNGQTVDVLLALHARRSAPSIEAWAQARGASHAAQGLGVVLTGTDLYRDVAVDASAKRSLKLAKHLVVLQECGPDGLAPSQQAKTRVIFQSTSTRQTLHKTQAHLRVLMVGHLRDEKSPQTLFEAARLLRDSPDIFIDHIGEPIDAALGQQASETQALCPNYRYFGGLAHEATRRHIQRAHLLVHASKMEGGAHVVMEAVCSGTPVLASRIAGNVGMLGASYPGYFAHGNTRQLAELLRRCRPAPIGLSDTPGTSGKFGVNLISELTRHCQARAPLFAPEKEQAALIQLVTDLLT